jgi:hypothetical protein
MFLYLHNFTNFLSNFNCSQWESNVKLASLLTYRYPIRYVCAPVVNHKTKSDLNAQITLQFEPAYAAWLPWKKSSQTTAVSIGTGSDISYRYLIEYISLHDAEGALADPSVPHQGPEQKEKSIRMLIKGA